MSNNPSVCAIMLVNGREAMVARVIRSFQAQTYQEKRLVVYDNSTEDDPEIDYPKWIDVAYHERAGRSIGLLRNGANGHAEEDVIVHFDSDDVSHPNRIAEQVALLQASGKECVGYRDMLFWDSTRCMIRVDPSKPGPGGKGVLGTVESVGEAWLYTNAQPSYCLGTSLCYWRRTWERRPFEDLPKGPMGMGEDHQWLTGVDSLGVSCRPTHRGQGHEELEYEDEQPRMIASVHGGNSTDILRVAIQVKDKMLRRAPEFDTYCRERMTR